MIGPPYAGGVRVISSGNGMEALQDSRGVQAPQCVDCVRFHPWALRGKHTAWPQELREPL
eukprot:3990446-Lingulodinium_polyedra.AAC.1